MPPRTKTATIRRRRSRVEATSDFNEVVKSRGAVSEVPVVGIGASAGGLEALKAFFTAMPSKAGLAFVVVVHLDPTHESLLPELLAPVAGLPVARARDRQPLEADHVYVIPPKRMLSIEHGLIRVRNVADRRNLRGVIDCFFRSLAGDQRDRAVAIVLSGTGTEGTVGAGAVRAHGGLVLAQTPTTASHPGMPASVIAAGHVDIELAPGEMPEALLEYVRSGRVRRQTSAPAESKSLEGLAAIHALLRARTKYDFRGYRTGTVRRRIEHRMALNHLDDLGAYVKLLRSQPTEVDQLFKDLLISVTSFFRNPASFAELADKVLAGLVRRGPDTPIRIWVPGCATGEEAYSIAILLAELMAASRVSCPVQIFATDVNPTALEIARGGTYPESIALDMTPERLRRFFTRNDHRYTIAKSIRELMVFAVHNVISDPPFSRLDLVSCRNVLIYFEPEMQAKLLSRFHLALNPGGYLFLGSAEGVGRLEDLYASLSKRRRVFRRLGSAAHRAADLDAPRSVAADSGLASTRAAPQPSQGALADELLLAHFAPAAVVVRSTGHIVRFYGAMERYISLPTGDATLDVLTLAQDELKPGLRGALHEAVRRHRQTAFEAVVKQRDGGRKAVRVTVKPVGSAKHADPLWLLLFEEVLPPARVVARQAGGRQPPAIRRLEGELRATKREQKRLVDQLATSNEELRAAHEEVLSMNEELQSTNEELITSKEELQSINEELSTLNAQLQEKVHELTAINDDVANLLVSTDSATVFLDRELRIKRFTSAAAAVFNLQSVDLGRPVDHIASNLVDVDVSHAARTVLDRLRPIEQAVATRDGKQYLLRGLPYRTEDKRVQGVVLSLVDVTTLKHIEGQLRSARERVSADLRRMTRVHEVSTRLAGPGELQGLLDEILRAAVEITNAEMGAIQSCDDNGVWTMAANIGFEPPLADVFPGVGTNPLSVSATAPGRRVVIEDVAAKPTLLDSAALRKLTAAGIRGVQSTALVDRAGRLLGTLSTYYRMTHSFGEAEFRWLDLLARQAADIIDRRRAEALLHATTEQLEQRIAERTKWLTLSHQVRLAIQHAPSWDEGLHLVLRRICESEHWQIGLVYLPDPTDSNRVAPVIHCYSDERFSGFQAASERHYPRGESLPGRVYADGKQSWMNDPAELLANLPLRRAVARQAGLVAGVALPIKFGREVIGVLELFSDQPHPANEMLVDLMSDLGDQIGRVIEHERSNAHLADLLWREQQELLNNLHDSLGQSLTAVGVLSSALSQRLTAIDSVAAETGQEIAQQAHVAQDQVRQLARGLFPGEIEGDGLMPALRELRSTTESIHKIRVEIEGEASRPVLDSRAATQLFRIIQEGVTNAVRHAKADTIRIAVKAGPGLVRVGVIDNGIGMPAAAAAPREGMGLRIMAHRASSIGAHLSIGASPGGGTTVACTWREVPSLRAPTRS